MTPAFLGLALLLGASAASAAESPLCPGCNVILVSLDTLRADALGVLGSPHAATPNLDALARRGVLFSQAFSQTPNTFPSHMSLFTGLYPWRHGVNVPLRDVLPEKVPTLPQLLRGRGYRTLWFGPLDDDYLELKAGFGKGYDETRPWGASDFENAMIWLSSRPAGPFFAFLHSYHVHDPYLPRFESVLRLAPKTPRRDVPDREELRAEMRRRVLADPSLLFRPEAVAAHPEVFAAPEPSWGALQPLIGDRANLRTSPRALIARLYWDGFATLVPPSHLRFLYDALALELDERVGALMGALESAGLSEKTLVIFTADHGEEFYEHGMNQHRQLYVECTHVPMIFLVPGLPARRVDQIVRNIDVLPTILEAVGAAVPTGLDGTSLVPAMRGESLPGPRRALGYWSRVFSARDPDYAYLARLDPDGRLVSEELFDRRTDPGEKSNLLPARSEQASTYRALIPRVSTIPAKGAWDPRLTEEERQRILKTGYW